ncbi:MAG TPA: hypothetical protein VI197_13710 [Polyangiaceae bacterium]
MKVRAVALGEQRSNAIGTVELECAPFGLVIAYLGVGSFSEGYAPGALTRGTLVTLPYTAIRQARFEGERLLLEVDPQLTPHHKLVLGGFTIGDGTHRHELYRQRLVLRTGAFGFALVCALVAALAVPRLSPSSSATLAIGIAGIVAATVLGLGFFIDRKLVSGELTGEAAQNALVHDLRLYLPDLVRLDRPAPKPPKALPLPDFQGFLPRTTAAIVITLTAGGLAAVLVSKWMLDAPESVARADRTLPEAEASDSEASPAAAAALELDPAPVARSDDRAAPAAPIAAAPAAPPTAAPAPAADPAVGDVVRTGQCQCARSSSLLWQQAVPKLSVLVLSTKLRQEGRRKHLELDIAVVNNSGESLSDVTLRVNFFERDPPPSNQRHFSRHRVLFFEGPLEPGQAIKWSTEARGIEFELENPVQGDIGPGGDGAAPADAFAELLNANHRPVRLHGAMMLAYLGDVRAKEGALKLQDALRDEEASYLRRVLDAMAPVRPCQVEVSGAGATRQVKACVFNASAQKQEQLMVKLNALDAGFNLAHPVGNPPGILGERVWNLPGAIPPGQGARVETSVSLSEVKGDGAKAFEVLVGQRGRAF